MLRQLHSLPGLLATLVLCVVAATGVILALEPPLQRFERGMFSPQTTVAAVADTVVARNGPVARLVRGPNGTLTVERRLGGEMVTSSVDPATGELSPAREPSPVFALAKRLHRSLLLGDAGRAAVGIAALALLMLSISGLHLLARRSGGWRALLRPLRGDAGARWHCELARVAAIGLVLSAATGCYLSLVTFELVPDPAVQAGIASPPGFSNARPRQVPLALMPALQAVPLSDLRELTFPASGDPAVLRLVTAQGTSLLDRASGAVVVAEANSTAARIHEWIYRLHTGQGLWPLALALLLSAATIPVLAATGARTWWLRCRLAPRIARNAPARSADTVVLVGSEGGSTWRHAAALHDALTKAGHSVHTAPMSALARDYPAAARILILTATYGDGAAPQSARHFLSRLPRLRSRAPVAVLGFGDQSFSHYCRFAREVAAALSTRGQPELLPLALIDRQSSRDIASWIGRLSHVLGTPLSIATDTALPRTTRLKLVERTLYGEDVQAPTAILRFALDDPATGRRRRLGLVRAAAALPDFSPGDLVGILAPGSGAPRFYSLGSATADGMLEICVRKQPGGVCSSFLHGLAPGHTIEAFVKPNPAFRPAKGNRPLLLIGAGAGIAPLVGFARANHRRRPIHLYWGGRDPASDFLYEGDLGFYLSDRRLTRLRPVFSRVRNGGYVQDRLAAEANVIRDLVRSGAQIMVCGSRQMAAAVAATVDRVVAPIGTDLATLKARGRYVEDVY